MTVFREKRGMFATQFIPPAEDKCGLLGKHTHAGHQGTQFDQLRHNRRGAIKDYLSDVTFENLMHLEGQCSKNKDAETLARRREKHEMERQLAKSKVEPIKKPVKYKELRNFNKQGRQEKNL